MKNFKTKEMVLTALLTALTIIIPILFTPLRIVVGPYTATITAHVPTIIAMFVNPTVAILVGICSAIGFFISSTPVVALRAATHVIFGAVGAYMIMKKNNIAAVVVVTAVLHAIAETLVVYICYLCGMVATNDYSVAFFMIITFIGTAVHHCVDFAIAFAVIKALGAAKIIKK